MSFLNQGIFNTLNAIDGKRPKGQLALVPISGESVFAPTDNGHQAVLVPAEPKAQPESWNERKSPSPDKRGSA